MSIGSLNTVHLCY